MKLNEFEVLMERKPFRYWPRSVKLNMRQSITGWLKGEGWSRFKTEYDPVKYGEKGYEDAPYEETFFWNVIK